MEGPTIKEATTRRKVLQEKKKKREKELKKYFATSVRSRVIKNIIALSTKPREKREEI